MTSFILSQLGWDQSFAIPVANAENKALEEELQNKMKEKTDLKNKATTHRERCQAMREHLKNLLQEVSNTQGLCRAVQSDTESEAHLTALAEREMGRLRQDTNKMQDEIEELRARRNIQESNIFRTTQKLEELKEQLHWDQTELDSWLEEYARKDEDTMAIIKYSQQDESRIKDMTLQVEKLTQEARNKRKLLENELTETTAAQIALDKTADVFREAHRERQELIRQWEATVDQMRKRDQDLEQCATLMAEVKQEEREKEAIVKEKEIFLNRELDNNKEIMRKTEVMDRLAAKLREELQEKEKNRERLHNELDVLRRTVDRTATDLETSRARVANLKKDIKDKENRVQVAKVKNDGLREKLEKVNKSVTSTEERVAQMEQLLKEEEQAVKDVEYQVQYQQDKIFHKTQELQALRQKETELSVQISGSRVTITCLANQQDKLNRTCRRQQEAIYDQEIEIQMLKANLARLKGDVDVEEMYRMQVKVDQMEAKLESERKTTALLGQQLRKIQDDTRYMKKEKERLGIQESDLMAKIENLDQLDESTEKELKKIRLQKQEGLVEYSMLKLQVKRRRDLLYSKANGVLSLEKHRAQLQATMRERQEEIRVHKEMVFKQIRIIDQERQGLCADLHEKLFKIEKTQKRYEIFMSTLPSPEGEEENSEASFVIKVALQKEELQRKGDEMDAKIRKKEREMQALANTLHVVNSSNSAYRKAFNTVTDDSEEYQEKLRQEAKKKATEEKIRHKRRQIKELQDGIQDMKATLERLNQEEAEITHENNDTRGHILILKRELGSQQEKLDRVNKQCVRLSKEIRAAKSCKGETLVEQDIRLQQMKELHKMVNNMLLVAVERQPELSPVLEMYLQQASLTMPTGTSTPCSHRSSIGTTSRISCRSAASSVNGRVSVPVSTVDLASGLAAAPSPASSLSYDESLPSTPSSSVDRHYTRS